jgi:hypothetical protein
VIEVDRHVDTNGNAELAKRRLKIGAELARRKVMIRLDGHLMHVVYNDVLAKTLPSPISTPSLRGARIAASQLPPQPAGPMSVQRKVPRDGVVMVARQRLRIGRTYTGKIVTIHVEDTHFRVTCGGAQLSIHPRTTKLPIRRIATLRLPRCTAMTAPDRRSNTGLRHMLGGATSGCTLPQLLSTPSGVLARSGRQRRTARRTTTAAPTENAGNTFLLDSATVAHLGQGIPPHPAPNPVRD